jgi:hypothetical protein
MKIAGLFLLTAAAAVAAKVVNFDSSEPKQVPRGWSVAMTGQAAPPKWEIVRDESAPSSPYVLAQVSTDRTSGRFPLAIYEDSRLKDGEVEVRFKPIAGERDRAAGIVWRFRDENNYYIVRANALENNVVLYKVENGKRSSLAPKGQPPDTYGVKHTVPSSKWSSLSVTFDGPLFTVAFDGKELFEVEDGTFTEAGRIGLWTKADSVTHFDDFRFESR